LEVIDGEVSLKDRERTAGDRSRERRSEQSKAER
jgi:hypothetical protein